MGLAVLLCTTRPARAAWQCGAAGSGITAEILAQDGADFVASRADCQCRFPLVMRIASSCSRLYNRQRSVVALVSTICCDAGSTSSNKSWLWLSMALSMAS